MQVINVTRESGIPLMGCIAFGIIDRGTNLLQVRCTSICNASCTFCSTDGGPRSKHHKTQYVVDIDYLFKEVRRIAKIKGNGLIIFLDSVGEPMSHPQFVDLVRKLKKINEVQEIIVITNGTLLTKERVDALGEAGLDRLNISVHAIDASLAKDLFGLSSYNIEKIIDMIKYVNSKRKIEVMLTPVWLPCVNDKEIEKILGFCKENKCRIGLQKYEVYPYSRKMKGTKKITYWKFNHQLKEWAKKFDMPLLMKREDVDVEKRPRVPEVFEIGEKVQVIVKAPGWYPNQTLAVERNRCISILNCDKKTDDRVTIRIVENKNNIYMAEQV